MNVKSASVLIISAAIAVILSVSVLIPITSEAEHIAGTKEILSNAGTKAYTSSNAFELVYESGGNYTINGVVRDAVPAYDLILVSEGCSIGLGGQTTELAVIDYTSHQKEWITSGTVSFVLANHNYVLTTPTHTYTGTIDKALYYTGTEGDYLQGTAFSVNGNDGGYVKIGNNFWGSMDGIVYVDPLNDGETTISLQHYDDSFTWTESTEESVTWEVIQSEYDVYDVSAFELNAEEDPNILLVYAPAKYVISESNSNTALISIIPLLVIVGIVLAVIGSLVTHRD